MNTVWNFVVVEHPAIFAAFGTWLLGNICSTMPSPNESSGIAYRWVFSLASVVGSSLPRSIPNLRLGSSNPTQTTVAASPANEVPVVPKP